MCPSGPAAARLPAESMGESERFDVVERALCSLEAGDSRWLRVASQGPADDDNDLMSVCSGAHLDVSAKDV